MKRIFVCSPLKSIPPVVTPFAIVPESTREKNITRAERLCAIVARLGHAPFAPHAFYTRFLDDGNSCERTIGMEAGRAWLLQADEVWVWDMLGITAGMRSEIKLALLRSIPVFYNKFTGGEP